jgi:DNA-binding HxlR family transcriptional regulator
MKNPSSHPLSQRIMRGEVFSNKCPSREIFKHITNKWGLLALVALLGGTMRFSDLRRKLSGISEKMLSQTLQILEEDGFIIRKAYPVIPPHVEYSLSDIGKEIATRMEILVDWIEVNIPRIINHKTT